MCGESSRPTKTLNRVLMVLGAGHLVVSAAFVAVSVATHPFDSPFHHQYGQMLHVLIWNGTGRGVGNEWDTYTGVVRLWDDRGQLMLREEYLDGARVGVWIDYLPNGAIERVHEYRDGKPWNGVCNIVHTKAWRAEFRDGRPWNGVTWRTNAELSGSVDQFWIEGREVTQAEYASAPAFTHKQLTRPHGVVAPTD